MNKKRGPKPKYLNIACPNPKCKDHGKKGMGNVVSNGTYLTRSTGKARLFLCRTCSKAFSSRTGTIFFNLRTRKRRFRSILRWVAFGHSVRRASYSGDIHPDTLWRWLAVAALHREQVTDMLIQEFKLSKSEVHVFWKFVKKRVPHRIDISRKSFW